MADGVIQVAPDSTGKKVDTSELTVNAQTVERQRVVLADPTSPTGLAPVTAANGALVDVSRVQGAVTIFNGTTDSGNSSTTPLAANGVFNGAWLDCFNQGSVLVYLFSNVSSAANGLSLQWSNDGVNADETYAETFTAGGRALVLQVTQRGRYFRLVYTNGGTIQASFRLDVIHKITTPSGDVEELSDVLSLDDHGMITIPVLAAKNAAGSAIGYLAQSNAAPAGTENGLVVRNIPSGVQTIQGVQDTATSGSIIASTTVVGPLAVTQRNVVTISIRGTYAGVTFIIEASDDGGTSWFPLQVIDNSTGQAASTWTPGTNASASYDAAIGGFTHVRVRATAWTSGTAVVTLTAQSFAYDPVVAALCQGIAPAASAIKGNPVPVGGTFTTTLPTYTTGQQTWFQTTARGELLCAISSGATAVAVKAASTAAAFTDPALTVDPRPGGALVTASAAMADAFANPTLGKQAVVNMVYNGSSWDLQRGMSGNLTTGDTGAKTATGNGATLTNVGNKGVQVVVNLGTVSGTTPTCVFKLQGSADGGTTWYDIPGAVTASLTATGVYGITVYPGIAVTAGTTTTGSTATANMPLPRTWRVVWTIGGTTPSFTITNIQYNYLPN